MISLEERRPARLPLRRKPPDPNVGSHLPPVMPPPGVSPPPQPVVVTMVDGADGAGWSDNRSAHGGGHFMVGGGGGPSRLGGLSRQPSQRGLSLPVVALGSNIDAGAGGGDMQLNFQDAVANMQLAAGGFYPRDEHCAKLLYEPIPVERIFSMKSAAAQHAPPPLMSTLLESAAVMLPSSPRYTLGIPRPPPSVGAGLMMHGIAAPLPVGGTLDDMMRQLMVTNQCLERQMDALDVWFGAVQHSPRGGVVYNTPRSRVGAYDELPSKKLLLGSPRGRPHQPNVHSHEL